VNDDQSVLRVASQWLVAAILTVLVALLSLSVLGTQVTSEETGHRIQRRAAATLTDIDQVLPGIEVKLKESAQGAPGPVRVPDYPIPIDLPQEDAERLQGPELRKRLLDESAKVLYQDGMSAWAKADPEARQDIDRVSSAGAVYRGLGVVRDDANTYFLVAAAVLAVLTLLIAALLTLTIRSGFMRLIAIGAVILAASLPCLAAAVAARFAFKTSQSDGDPFVDGLLDLGVDAMWLPIRMYLALGVLGLAVIVVSAVLMWIASRSAGGSTGGVYGGGRPGPPPPRPARPPRPDRA
jgi:hypothetical protein